MSENQLLATLSSQAWEQIAPDIERVPLTLHETLYDQNQVIRQVYFPLSGVISVLCLAESGASIEACTIGCEGMAGIPVFLGADLSPNRAIVQVYGEAWKLKAEAFRKIARQNVKFHELLHSYTFALMTQISLSVGCNRFHSVENRLARWLLMMQDRTKKGEFSFTQELISRMIGTQRPHVSTAIANLHSDGLIKTGRGRIKIVNRTALKRVACSCYLAAVATHDGILNT